MTLHALRLTIGDDAFFHLLSTWIEQNTGQNVTTDGFIALAEEISGHELDAFFQAWLFTGTRPPRPVSVTAVEPFDLTGLAEVVRSQVSRIDKSVLTGE